MCDTLYKHFPSGESLFLKNSDRSPNEPNLLMYYERRKAGPALKCTYITIPDSDAYQVILVKPSWIWGAEMGINEFGVAIGNEAVWTHSQGKKVEKLLGMDLLRLGLERGKTALEAMNVIISLLKEYGQGGNGGFDKPFYYDNSFLIADNDTGYILETAGKNYVFKKVNEGNISNRLSIDEGDFRKKNSDPIFNFFSGSKNRSLMGEKALSRMESLDKGAAFDLLRSHEEGTTSKKLYQSGSLKSLCMHAGGLGDETTGSLAIFYTLKGIEVWSTGSSSPCLSLFKPVLFSFTFGPLHLDKEEALRYWIQREEVKRCVISHQIEEISFKQKEKVLQNSFINDFDGSKESAISIYEREAAFYASYNEIVKSFDASKMPKYWKNQQTSFLANPFAVSYKEHR